ncbi:MAG: HAMP domain-containing protein [Actinomycetia bacterium]|nr:HAMP domain-containing protein [Actinomycetes bacterium]
MNTLIAVPLLALIAFAAVGYFALQRSSVRGDEYKALKQAQDLRADVLPPPASLLEAWATVNHIGVIAASADGFSPDNVAEIDGELAALASSQVQFEASMAYWSQQGLDERVDIRLIQIGGRTGTRFFQVIEDELKPAVAAQDVQGVIEVVRSMEWRFELQQTGVDRANVWAEREVRAREVSTSNYVDQIVVYAGAGAAVILLLTLLLSVFVRRSIVSPIRLLASRAKSVASNELPAAVQYAQQLAPDAPAPHLAPFDIGTRDELAELGASFNSVQDAAVDLAVEQAMARRVVSENLVNIARRNQNLLGRTLGFISTLEQGERDPEALDNLFRLDHLSTRMRRNAQSLLVLAGAEPTRLWAPAVSLGDVVRAALSEVENYGQVELAVLGDIGVQGAVASEIAHLLAELLENATSFSPPNTAVTVVGRAVPDGHQLAIFDYGLGMSTEDLAEANRRLNQVSSFDRESNKMLGFQVVARLAARHQVKVMLTTTPGGTGVTAIVRLPKSILEAVGAPGATVPPVEVPAMAHRLSEPLTVNAGPPPISIPPQVHVPSEMTDEALWAAMSPSVASTESNGMSPQVGLQPPTVAVGQMPIATDALSKRVPGAQLPDLGRAQPETMPTRAADDVRSTLTSLQRGVELGRNHEQKS